MKRIPCAAMVAGALTGFPLSAAPPPVGTISDDVGYSQATNFDGSNYQSLTQRQLSDDPETVLAIVFATPW